MCRKIISSMKNLFIVLLLILIPVYGQATSLKWDPVTEALGYIIYYTDGTNLYHKNVGNVTIYPLETDLNLQPGVEYTFYVTCFDEIRESEPSNTVAWIRAIFSSGDDVTPPTVITIPQGTTVTIAIE